MGRGFLAATQLLFCVKDARGQENFHACLPRIDIHIRSFLEN